MKKEFIVINRKKRTTIEECYSLLAGAVLRKAIKDLKIKYNTPGTHDSYKKYCNEMLHIYNYLTGDDSANMMHIASMSQSDVKIKIKEIIKKQKNKKFYLHKNYVYDYNFENNSMEIKNIFVDMIN